MSTVIVGGTAISVAVQGNKRSRTDGTDRHRRFDNSYGVSQVGGAARDFYFTTPPLPIATIATYHNLLSNIAPQLCSGDIISIPTMCCAEIVDWTPIATRAGLYGTISFILHEVQSSRILLKYSPGDTIAGESFARAVPAYQLNAAGVYEQKAANVKRDGHYIGGIRSLLLEGVRTNSCLYSNDLTNAAWLKGGASSQTKTLTGLDGSANSGTVIGDTDAANATSFHQSVTVANDNATHCIAFWVKKDTDQTRFPEFQFFLSGGTAVNRVIGLNTQTGAYNTQTSVGTTTVRVIDAGLWWIVEITGTNNSTGNTSLGAWIYPARENPFGTVSVATLGTVGIGNVHIELNSSFVSSPIITTSAAGTRAADSYSLPFTVPPQEMTVYTKFTDEGISRTANARLWAISNGAGTPEFVTFTPADGFYYVEHIPGPVAAVNIPVSSVGDTWEFGARLLGDGSVDAQRTINGGAETDIAPSVPTPFASAWSGQLCWLNSGGAAAFTGFTAIESFKIVAGARSLDEMRAA